MLLKHCIDQYCINKIIDYNFHSAANKLIYSILILQYTDIFMSKGSNMQSTFYLYHMDVSEQHFDTFVQGS